MEEDDEEESDDDEGGDDDDGTPERIAKKPKMGAYTGSGRDLVNNSLDFEEESKIEESVNSSRYGSDLKRLNPRTPDGGDDTTRKHQQITNSDLEGNVTA